MPSVPSVYRVQAARTAVSSARQSAIEGQPFEPAQIQLLANELARKLAGPSLAPAINATGIVLHTGLGRARLAPEAADAMARAAANHATLEIDPESGHRGDRQKHVQDLLCHLTGAESAMVVNNCAAAVLLSLTALAQGREVILSRGQMVEIGGSFRLPEVIEASGCVLVEVGCTNKTRIADYTRAIEAETALLLRCHPSNYAIVGFSQEASLQELAGLAAQFGIGFVNDMGSGCLVDLSTFGMPRQETLQDSVRWAHVTTASADKLLGGPQAGMILGRESCLKRIRSHPLARAVRADKASLAGLEATLRMYAEGREHEIPTLKYIARTAESLKPEAERLASAFGGTVEPSFSMVGGGSVPGEQLPTWVACLTNPSADALMAKLRDGTPPIFARIEGGRVLLDPRTMEAHEIDAAEAVLRTLIQP